MIFDEWENILVNYLMAEFYFDTNKKEKVNTHQCQILNASFLIKTIVYL